MDEPEFSEGARLLFAARAIPTAHHALVKLLFGANDTVTASMDAAALDTDGGAVRGTRSPVYHLTRTVQSQEGPVSPTRPAVHQEGPIVKAGSEGMETGRGVSPAAVRGDQRSDNSNSKTHHLQNTHDESDTALSALSTRI